MEEHSPISINVERKRQDDESTFGSHRSTV